MCRFYLLPLGAPFIDATRQPVIGSSQQWPHISAPRPTQVTVLCGGESKMLQQGVSIFQHWRELAQLIIEEHDEETQADLVKLLRHSYEEEMFRLSKRHTVY